MSIPVTDPRHPLYRDANGERTSRFCPLDRHRVEGCPSDGIIARPPDPSITPHPDLFAGVAEERE